MACARQQSGGSCDSDSSRCAIVARSRLQAAVDCGLAPVRRSVDVYAQRDGYKASYSGMMVYRCR
jgi:hypothetical protein